MNIKIDHQIMELVKRLDTSKTLEQDEIWFEIKKKEIDVPYYFLNAYPLFKKWQGRIHLVFSCIKHARISENAFQLGILALNDKASLVRYRAAALLAYSLREDAIPYLQKNLLHKDLQTAKDSERAIQAIQQKNHHIFMKNRADRWIVNEEDAETKK
jgi:hypothetical protein